jgi:hypothetical protein
MDNGIEFSTGKKAIGVQMDMHDDPQMRAWRETCSKTEWRFVLVIADMECIASSLEGVVDDDIGGTLWMMIERVGRTASRSLIDALKEKENLSEQRCDELIDLGGMLYRHQRHVALEAIRKGIKSGDIVPPPGSVEDMNLTGEDH